MNVIQCRRDQREHLTHKNIEGTQQKPCHFAQCPIAACGSCGFCASSLIYAPARHTLRAHSTCMSTRHRDAVRAQWETSPQPCTGIRRWLVCGSETCLIPRDQPAQRDSERILSRSDICSPVCRIIPFASLCTEFFTVDLATGELLMHPNIPLLGSDGPSTGEDRFRRAGSS
jgi:hypothetical protein